MEKNSEIIDTIQVTTKGQNKAFPVHHDGQPMIWESEDVREYDSQGRVARALAKLGRLFDLKA